MMRSAYRAALRQRGRRTRLVRSVHGQLRGWLSDKYRRLDSRPLVDALADEARSAGSVPVDGIATETRVAIKVIIPRILEPIPGEFLVYGGEWSNIDFGNGTHSFRTFALRVACLTGMTRENLLKQVHMGARLSDEIEFSDRTHRLDTAASVSALRDVVRGALGPASRDRMIDSVRTAHDRAMSKTQLSTATRTLSKQLQKSERRKGQFPSVVIKPRDSKYIVSRVPTRSFGIPMYAGALSRTSRASGRGVGEATPFARRTRFS
ncbi:MAG: hypothetical protein M3O46_03970 [Myxococcota bacterium]|nr:hypothetical protein [Myxococcota bacterium]